MVGLALASRLLLRVTEDALACLLFLVAEASIECSACRGLMFTLISQSLRISVFRGEYSRCLAGDLVSKVTAEIIDLAFVGELLSREMPDLFFIEALLPYSLAFSRLAFLMSSAWVSGPLRLEELFRLRAAAPYLVALELLFRFSLTETTGCSTEFASAFSCLPFLPPLYLARLCFLSSSSFYFCSAAF